MVPIIESSHWDHVDEIGTNNNHPGKIWWIYVVLKWYRLWGFKKTVLNKEKFKKKVVFKIVQKNASSLFFKEALWLMFSWQKNIFFFFFKVFTSAVDNLKIVIFNVYVSFCFFKRVFFFVKTQKLILNVFEKICLCFHRFANSADTPLKNFAVGPPPIMMTLCPRLEIWDTLSQIRN